MTARASDSMFYPSTLCALQIVFMIMIIMIVNRKPGTQSIRVSYDDFEWPWKDARDLSGGSSYANVDGSPLHLFQIHDCTYCEKFVRTVDLRSCHLTNSYQICPGDPRGVSGRVLGAATPLHVAEMRRAVC